jgi:ubiquinone/menaquinone biosynthesis C-methylase UbiE
MNAQRFEEKGESPGPPYTYYYDGFIRRSLHDFGATGFNFYQTVLQKMGYHTNDIVLDVGAGGGEDGVHIAEKYNSRLIFLLEPNLGNYLDINDRYFPLVENIKRRGLQGIELLPAPGSTDIRPIIQPHTPEPNITYMQPLAARAESIPLPNDSVTKLSMIHTAYEFDDLDKALSEAARVMAPGSLGVAITNGSGDKKLFKQMMQEVGDVLGMKAPSTVSSKLDYLQLRAELKKYFSDMVLFPYQDQMLINNDFRRVAYDWAFNSYRRFYERPVINDGRWQKAKEQVFSSHFSSDIHDTIDVAAIFFSNPAK